MPASYPKPDAERRNRVAPTFGWVYLAAHHRLKPPPLPKDREWLPETVAWWRGLWSRPQAVMWDQSGMTLQGLARLYQASLEADKGLPAIYAEMRQIEDRHGLNPKALLQLRWRIGDPGDLAEESAVSPAAGRSGMSAAKRRSLMRSLGEVS